MLTISHGAAEVIKVLVASSELSEAGGIRLSVEAIDQQNAKLELSLADSPEPGDALIEEEGAHVFVEQNATTILDDKVLDATVEGDAVAFSIADRAPDWSQNGRPKNVDPGSLRE